MDPEVWVSQPRDGRGSVLAFFFLTLHLRQAICLGVGIHGLTNMWPGSCISGVAITMCFLVSFHFLCSSRKTII